MQVFRLQARNGWASQRPQPAQLRTVEQTTERAEDGVISTAGLRVTDAIEQFGSPVYLMDEQDFRHRAREFRDAFEGWTVYYAGKAFLTRTVAARVDEEGLSLDVCSTAGELATALQAGFDPARIGMHGNNKSVDERRRLWTRESGGSSSIRWTSWTRMSSNSARPTTGMLA